LTIRNPMFDYLEKFAGRDSIGPPHFLADPMSLSFALVLEPDILFESKYS